MANVRLIKHEAFPKCGSFEVRFADGAPSKFFYWDDVLGRRLRPEHIAAKPRWNRPKPLPEPSVINDGDDGVSLKLRICSHAPPGYDRI
jgi:hypothetical protein